MIALLALAAHAQQIVQLEQTFAFEDVAVSPSDTDWNDQNVRWQGVCDLDGSGFVRRHRLAFTPSAAGASLDNDLALRIPAGATTVTVDGAPVTPVAGVVTLLSPFKDGFVGNPGGFVNSDGDYTTVGLGHTVTITYVPAVDFGGGCPTPGFELHRGALVLDEDSRLDGTGHPIAASFDGWFRAPAEHTPITAAYPGGGGYPSFLTWAADVADGTCDTACSGPQWYDDPAAGPVDDRTSLQLDTTAPIPVIPYCTDGVQNGDEAGVDCGDSFGSCPACGGTFPITVGGLNADLAEATAIDAAGNVYVVGSFEGTLAFGPHTITAAGTNDDAFVAKLTPDGTWAWARAMGGTPADKATDVTVSGTDLYVTGYFQGNGTFGSTVLTSVGSYDAFVVKLSATTGAVTWATSAGGSAQDLPEGIAVDASGNVFVVGTFRNTATFGTTLTSAGLKDMFAAKLNASGVWQWGRRCGNSDEDLAHDVAVTSTGDIYVVGEYILAPTGLQSFCTGVSNVGMIDVLVSKIATNGNTTWTSRGGGGDWDRGWGVAVDASNNAVVVGDFRSTATFGSFNVTSNGSNSDAFVGVISSSGVWSQPIGAGGTGTDYAYKVAVVGADRYVTGEFTTTNATFGATTLASTGSFDGFVARTTAAGGWVWAKRFGGTAGDYANGVVATPTYVYPVGYFQNTATFGTETRVSAGAQDLFVGRLDAATGAW